MSIAPLDPPGIDAAGMSRIVFVQALSDPTAPTTTEIKAGTDLSCALYGFSPTVDQGTVTRTKYCYKQSAESLGRANVTIEAIEYDYNPQDPEDEDYAYYSALEPGTHGYIVDRRGLDARTADWEAEQIVDIYPATLGARGRVAIDPTAEGEKLRTRQAIAVRGEALMDVTIAS